VDASWIALLTLSSRRLDGGRRVSQDHPPATTHSTGLLGISTPHLQLEQ